MRHRKRILASPATPWRAAAFAAALALAFVQTGRHAAAQAPPPNCPCPAPPASGDGGVAGSGAAVSMMSQFLSHQSRQMAAARLGLPAAGSAGGQALPFAFADASEAHDPLRAYAAAQPNAAVAELGPQYRAWLEGYGFRSRTDSQGAFVGDSREVVGGIVGVGRTLAPGVNFAVSVDQGRTKVDLNGQPQSARMDITQVGALLTIDSGPWSFGVSGVHGFGRIRSSRIDAGGENSARYGVQMWGSIAELSYYWTQQNWRVVPKLGADWAHVEVDAYAESGGAVPVSATGQTNDRVRMYAGIEFGHTAHWSAQQAVDVSVYGKFIDIVHQQVDALMVTPQVVGFASAQVPGLVDAQFEFATGAVLAVKLSQLTRVYALYDARFRRGFDSHGGTVGVEFRW